MAYEYRPIDGPFARYVIHESDWGWYVLIWSKKPRDNRDYLQDSKQLAIEFCERKFGVPTNVWTEIPDEVF